MIIRTETMDFNDDFTREKNKRKINETNNKKKKNKAARSHKMK